jgi:glutaredoxin
MAAVLAATGLSCVGALAQTVYRQVGPDGRVSFSDRPPAQEAQQAPTAPAATAGPADSNAALPYALRQTASRYPVTLYTSTDCAPCDNARQLLQSRGIPYAERTLASEADFATLQKISQQTSLPFATLGKQFLVGFSSSEWTQYLDAAGYPASSQLPPQYKRPSPQPLTPAGKAGSAAAPAAAPAPAVEEGPRGRMPLPAAPGGMRTNENPAGLSF